jgi:hypothetical protein
MALQEVIYLLLRSWVCELKDITETPEIGLEVFDSL